MLHSNFQGHQGFCFGEDDYGFLQYLVMAAILVMWPGLFEQTSISLCHKGFICNLASISLVKKIKTF